MSHFSYQDGVLHAEGVPLSAIAAAVRHPDLRLLESPAAGQLRRLRRARAAGRDALVCYAMKANSNLAILDLLARQGAGFDIVSGGELLRVIAAGGDPGKVIFSGVGKTVAEIELALDKGILCFNVESIPELHRINEVAGRLGKRAPVSLRVNPNVDAKTHPYIATGLKASKFGVAFSDALATYRAAAALPHLDVVGIDCHIGSQLLDDAPLLEALDKLIELIDTLAAEGIHLHHLDVGGGLGIDYGTGEAPPVPIGDYVDARVRARGRLARREARRPADQGDLRAGPLDRRQHRRAADVGRVPEAGRGKELLRGRRRHERHGAPDPVPGLDGRQAGRAARRRAPSPTTWSARCANPATGWRATATLAVEPGDVLAMMAAGAYGFTMASNYNTRGRAAEVLVDGDQVHLIRRRASCCRKSSFRAGNPGPLSVSRRASLRGRLRRRAGGCSRLRLRRLCARAAPAPEHAQAEQQRDHRAPDDGLLEVVLARLHPPVVQDRQRRDQRRSAGAAGPSCGPGA